MNEKNKPGLWFKRLNMVKMSNLPKWIHGFNTIPVKIFGEFFVDIDKLIQIFIYKGKELELKNRF